MSLQLQPSIICFLPFMLNYRNTNLENSLLSFFLLLCWTVREILGIGWSICMESGCCYDYECCPLRSCSVKSIYDGENDWEIHVTVWWERDEMKNRGSSILHWLNENEKCAMYFESICTKNRIICYRFWARVW